MASAFKVCYHNMGMYIISFDPEDIITIIKVKIDDRIGI